MLVATSIVCGSLVFLALLALTLVCLYRKHRRHPLPQPVAIIPSGVFLQQPEQASPQLETYFPLQRFVSLDSPISLICAVCQEEFIKSSEVRTLPCSHTYHNVCLKQLFSQNWKCVVCSQSYMELSMQTRMTENFSQMQDSVEP